MRDWEFQLHRFAGEHTLLDFTNEVDDDMADEVQQVEALDLELGRIPL